MPMNQVVALGPFTFTVVRMLIAAGCLRVMVRSERPVGGFMRLDRLMVIWAAILLLTALFHLDPSAQLVYRLGLVFDAFGTFLLFRIFVQGAGDLRRVCAIICVLLVPVAIAMVVERLTGKNYFALCFGDMGPELRDGSYRAHGPFYHAILGGTIGAASLPMALYLWRDNRTLAFAGACAAIGIVFSSGSSGPIMTLLIVVVAMALWWQRHTLPAIRWLTVIALIALQLVMNSPVYYLLARIDITGGSTGYHRARLIESAIEHFDEWWLVGTDYTRHWMASGIPANDQHTDLTNHYIAMGVMGGLPLMLVFIWMLVAGFAGCARALQLINDEPASEQFKVWILGCILFAHAMTFLSISYFGQVVFFFYLLVGCIGSVYAILAAGAELPDSGDEQTTVIADSSFVKFG